MKRPLCWFALAATFALACGNIQNPFASGPKVDPRFLDYGPEPVGYQDTIRASIESQVAAPEVLKGVEIGDTKKASYFPPALNASSSGKPVEYLGWKVEAKYTVINPTGGVTINRRVFFFNNNELVVVEKAASNAIR
ncbi:MAG: hypothetical protein IPK07_22140 [Deltaproteobacteria bacterium]|nr:hypothetical protein [Deltaproteobacteria bacterium]